MIKRVLTGAALGMSVSATALAQAPLSYIVSGANEQAVMMGGGPVGVMQGAPYLRFSVLELAYGTDLGGGISSWQYRKLTDELTPEGTPNSFGYDYGEGFGYRVISQVYRHRDDTSKTVEIRLFMEYLPAGADWAAQNGPAIRLAAYAEWLNGVPAARGGSGKIVGLVLRSDHDVPGGNNQGSELAVGVNKGLSASVGQGMTSTRLQWERVPYQPLARFFDTYERDVAAAGGSVFDLYLLSNDESDESYDVTIRRYQDDNGSFNGASGAAAQTATNPPYDYYADYVKPGDGSDQVAYMMTRRHNPSTSSYVWLEVDTLLVKRNGYRGIDLQWFHHHPEHGEPDYVADDGKSVRSVLESLHDSSPVYIRTQQAELTCPGNDCEVSELIDLQYLHNYDYGQDKSVLKTAMYVLRGDQTAPFGGVVSVNASHGFVIPNSFGGDKRAVYASILHELGHTFRFEHSWSRCASTNTCFGAPYCCENGDIMSYTHVLAMSQGWQHYDFDFTPDARRWFREAPLPYVESYLGGSAGNNNQTHPDLEPGMVLGW